MNKKGFAISGLIYTVLIVFIVILISILGLLNSRKNVLEKLKEKVLGEVNLSQIVKTENFTEPVDFKIKANGYYSLTLTSPRVNNTNGSKMYTEVYLKKDEIISILVGDSNYNSGITEVKSNNNTILKLSYNNSYMDIKTFLNTNINKNIINSTSGQVTLEYLSSDRKNNDLNNVRYIKNCINGNSSNISNNWAQIKAIYEGENVAFGKKNIGSSINNSNYITDGNLNTISSGNTKEQCIIIDLENSYSLDYIIVNHKPNITYYGNKTYVSSDNNTYDLVYMSDDLEDDSGNVISAFENEKVVLVGNVYVPIKQFDGATWIRVFHHNNLSGTNMWSSISQSLTQDGYDSLHRQSILYNLEEYRNSKNEFEFLLQYSDVSGYNRWIQTSNPIKTTESVTGYKAVKVSWTDNGFKGLAKSNYGGTTLDGSVGSDNWWYAIGVKNQFNGGVPAAKTVSAASTDLWVRIDNLK